MNIVNFYLLNLNLKTTGFFCLKYKLNYIMKYINYYYFPNLHVPQRTKLHDFNKTNFSNFNIFVIYNFYEYYNFHCF